MAGLDQNAINAAFSQPEHDGRFVGAFADYISQLAHRRRAVVLAFPPKAAGTFLRSAAIVAIDGQLIRITHAQGGRDAQPYVPILLAYYSGHLGRKTMVTHVHMQALEGNRGIVNVFGLKPIAMIRSIPDMLASYWDMLEIDDAALADGLNCQFPRNFRSLPRSRQGDFLVDIVAPWYAGYYATWIDYAAQSPDRVLMLDYGEFLKAPDIALETALRHAGVARSREVCQRAVEDVWKERTQWRYNQGVAGRGREYFSARQIQRVACLLGHYPALDAFAERLVR